MNLFGFIKNIYNNLFDNVRKNKIFKKVGVVNVKSGKRHIIIKILAKAIDANYQLLMVAWQEVGSFMELVNQHSLKVKSRDV